MWTRRGFLGATGIAAVAPFACGGSAPRFGGFTIAIQSWTFHAFLGLFGLHLKDVAAPMPGAIDTILGEGVLDLPGVFRTLRAVGFPADASLSVEYEANPEAPYDDLVIALANIERAVR